MAGTIRRLKELREKIGDTGVDKLFRAAKKEDLPGLSRQLVKDFLATDASRADLQEAPGV